MEPTTCFYLLMQIAYCYGWIRNKINTKFETNFSVKYFVAPEDPMGDSFKL